MINIVNICITELSKFFPKHLKKYHYIENSNGFNMGMCKFGDQEMFCVRMLGPIPAYFGEKVVPGNYSEDTYRQFSIIKKQKLCKFGINFFWNSWRNLLIDNTIFFLGTISENGFKINTKIKPYVISNKIALTVDSSNRYMYSDVRLFSVGERVICYDGLISSIYEIVVIDNKLVCSANFDMIPVNVIIINRACENIKKFDKNWSLVSKIIHNSLPAYEFLNWFENGWVTRSVLYFDKNLPCVKEKLFKMKLDRIEGLGSDYLPMFSFGSPCIELEPGVFVGCGHLKFLVTKKYKNEKVSQFIKKVCDLRCKYDNYIQHASYIYSMYFFKYIRGSSFLISDSILIISNYEYCFSINFPMGIIEKDGSIIVSYGYGDFYNVVAIFCRNELESLIKHDVTNFNINSFEFYIFSDLNK